MAKDMKLRVFAAGRSLPQKARTVLDQQKDNLNISFVHGNFNVFEPNLCEFESSAPGVGSDSIIILSMSDKQYEAAFSCQFLVSTPCREIREVSFT